MRRDNPSILYVVPCQPPSAHFLLNFLSEARLRTCNRLFVRVVLLEVECESRVKVAIEYLSPIGARPSGQYDRYNRGRWTVIYPRKYFLVVGSLGLWSEWHTSIYLDLTANIRPILSYDSIFCQV